MRGWSLPSDRTLPGSLQMKLDRTTGSPGMTIVFFMLEMSVDLFVHLETFISKKTLDEYITSNI